VLLVLLMMLYFMFQRFKSGRAKYNWSPQRPKAGWSNSFHCLCI